MLPGNQQNNDYDPWSLLEGEDEEPVDSDSLSDKGERAPSTPVKPLDTAQSDSVQTTPNRAGGNVSTPPPLPPARPSLELEEKRKEDEEKLRREKEDALLVAQSAEKIRKEEQIKELIKKQQEEQGVQREKEDALTAAKELEEAKRRIEELEASLGVKSEQITKEKAPIAAPKSELPKPNKADEPATEKQEDDLQSPNKVTINRSLFNK